MSLIVAAHDEEASIARWVRSSLALDYPRERLEVVVVSDGSTDRTLELATEAGADLVLEVPRGGKVAALNAAVEKARGEVLAFSDANSTWEREALGRLVARFADPRVGYVCGQLRLEGQGGENQEGLYWRYETATRALESRLAGVTAGNGAINAVRRDAYIALEPTRGQDISLPYELTKRGWRAVFEPAAVAREPMAATLGSEFRRKRRMLAGAWATMLRHGMLVAARLRARLRLRDPLPPRPALPVADPPPGCAGDEPGAPRAGRAVRRHPRRPARVARLRGAGARGAVARLPGRAVLRRGHRGERRGPLGLPAPRRAPDLGEGGGDEVRGPAMSRALDIALAGIGLALSAPLMLIAAVAIKLDSRGPVIYRQRRVGKDGRQFEVYKLRTMRPGADPVGVGTPVLEDDPRVTRVGRLLRRVSLDEIPNLVNVLRGELAIVGPRPTLAAQVELYTERQRRRLEVKPGITGWAQVNGRAGIPWEERIELDIWYVDNRSLALDLRILGRTARLLLSGHGLYG